MLTDRMRLAFSIENVYAGFAKVTGIFRVLNDELVLEFETKENLFGGVLKSRPKKVDIPLLEIESVTLRKRWFSTKVIIRVLRLDLLNEVPGTEKGEAVLKIRRKERSTAETLISKINLRISELGLDPHERGESML